MTKGPLTSLWDGTFPTALFKERWGDFGRILVEAFASERDRLVLWIPVVLGCGIGGYFALPAEPPVLIFPMALLVCCAVFIVGRGQFRRTILFIFILILGLGLAQWRSLRVAAPILSDKVSATFVTANVVSVEPQSVSGVRLVLSEMEIEGLAAEKTPRRARLTVRTDHGDIKADDTVRVRVTLDSPPEPVAPYAYDFARVAWFDGVGAVGYAMGPVELLQRGEITHMATRLERLRAFVAARVMARAGPEGGPIAAALLTGVRGPISEDDKEAMRIAGLAHLLAISGLHIGLVTATAFFMLRVFCALIPPLALKLDTKKIAASGAWIVALFYFQLAGASIPTQRAFMMVSIMLLALLLGRQPLSLRLVAFSALVILVLTPEALLSASFHMSFAAVTTLVVVYRSLSPRLAAWRRHGGSIRRIVFYFLSVILTTLIAEVAIAPFAAFHFNQFTSYGLLANLVVVPVMAMWIMPMGLLALVLMPFGLDGFAVDLMGYGVVLMLRTAHQVSSLPFAHFVVPSYPVAALVLVTLAGLWILLWRHMALRILALPLFVMQALILAQNRPPDLLVSRKADLFGVLSDDGLGVSSMTKARYSREQWTRLLGERESYVWSRAQGKNQGQEHGNQPAPARCDSFGCTIMKGSHRISFAHSPEALMEDCRRATLVIASIPIRQACPSPMVRIDRFDVSRNGAYALWLDDKSDQIRMESVRSVRGARPWVLSPKIYSDDGDGDDNDDSSFDYDNEVAQ